MAAGAATAGALTRLEPDVPPRRWRERRTERRRERQERRHGEPVPFARAESNGDAPRGFRAKARDLDDGWLDQLRGAQPYPDLSDLADNPPPPNGTAAGPTVEEVPPPPPPRAPEAVAPPPPPAPRAPEAAAAASPPAAAPAAPPTPAPTAPAPTAPAPTAPAPTAPAPTEPPAPPAPSAAIAPPVEAKPSPPTFDDEPLFPPPANKMPAVRPVAPAPLPPPPATATATAPPPPPPAAAPNTAAPAAPPPPPNTAARLAEAAAAGAALTATNGRQHGVPVAEPPARPRRAMPDLPPPAGVPVAEPRPPAGPRLPLPPPVGPPVRDSSVFWPEARPAEEPLEAPPAPIRKGALIAAVLVVLAAVALGFFVMRGNKHSGAKAISYPKAWDSRLDAERQFVQNERHATFPHPVAVEFVTPNVYTQRVQALATSRKDAIEAFLRLPPGVLRALGIAQGAQDLSQTAQLIDDARGAIYDPTTRMITVQGTTPDQSTQVQIVRALVLALDGQLYGELSFSDPQAEFGYRAVREGDAQRVVDAYLGALDPDERQGIIDPYAVASPSISEPSRALERATATLGEQLVVQAQAGGEASLAALLRRPPATQEQVYDPTKYPTEDAKSAPAPKLESGETSTGHGTLGNLVWLVMLGEHAPADSTVLASDGWGGDNYVTYQFQTKDCISTNWVGDTPQDVNEMTATLRQWTTAMSPGNAQFTTENNVVTVTACDPGLGASVTTGKAKDAYDYVAFRAAVFGHEVANMPGTKAWCVAKQTAAAASPQDRTNPSVIDSPSYASKLSQFEQSCS